MPYPEVAIGMAQMLVEGGDLAGNLERAVAMITEASQLGCAVVVLPECLDAGWAHPSATELAQPIPGPMVNKLAGAARANNIFVAAGITECANDRIYNSAVLIGADGNLLLLHRKINELPIAQDIYAIGDRLGVVETPFGVVGLDICSDNFGTSMAIGHTLCRMGAHFIFSPSSWAVEATHNQETNPYGTSWRQSHRELSRLYGITIASVSNVGLISEGPLKGRKAIGSSLAFGPAGEAIAQGPFGEAAQQLVVFRARAVERLVKGSSYAPYLKAKGYDGP